MTSRPPKSTFPIRRLFRSPRLVHEYDKLRGGSSAPSGSSENSGTGRYSWLRRHFDDQDEMSDEEFLADREHTLANAVANLEKYRPILNLVARLPDLGDDIRVEASAAVAFLGTGAEYATEEAANDTAPKPDDGPGLLRAAGLPADTDPLSAAWTAGTIRKAVTAFAGAMKRKCVPARLVKGVAEWADEWVRDAEGQIEQYAPAVDARRQRITLTSAVGRARRTCVAAPTAAHVARYEGHLQRQLTTTLDVHALRTTFGTLLSANGVAPRTAQQAMRHSDIKLTMGVYTDRKLLDVAGALDALPALPLVPRLALPLAPARGMEGQFEARDGNGRANIRKTTGRATIAGSGLPVHEKSPLPSADSGPSRIGTTRRQLNYFYRAWSIGTAISVATLGPPGVHPPEESSMLPSATLSQARA
jgi:hypothetical protein